MVDRSGRGRQLAQVDDGGYIVFVSLPAEESAEREVWLCAALFGRDFLWTSATQPGPTAHDRSIDALISGMRTHNGRALD
jgi:hypothetical protein